MAALDRQRSIVIIGGGWAGLSAAIHLTHQGHSVHLFEASRQLGGRARSATMKTFQIDNGQHISLGACQETLKLLQILKIPESNIFYRQALNLILYSPKRSEPFRIKTNYWPAPFHLLFGLITASGFNKNEKISLLKVFISLALKRFSLKNDQTLLTLLHQYRQPQRLIKYFWEPLCLSILNTPIEIASAEILLKVLNESFSQNRQFSDILLFKKSLHQSLAEPAKNYIIQPGGCISLQEKVISLKTKNYRIQSIQTRNNSYPVDDVILATPKHVTRQLLAPFKNCQAIVSNLNKIKDEPIYTIYLFYQKSFQLSDYMLGLVDSYSQWLFDHRLTQQAGMLAVVISGPGKHQKLSKIELISIIDNEIRAIFPHLPPLIEGKVLIEKKATFSCTSGINKLRPKQHLPIKGLYLAGDYTRTGYPSTLEGAVISGVTAAQSLLENRSP